MRETATYSLRLPRSIKAAVEKMALSEGISMNQFVAIAVAEKLAVLNTAAYFTERKGRADFSAFKRILKRKGGEKPREGDEKSWSWISAVMMPYNPLPETFFRRMPPEVMWHKGLRAMGGRYLMRARITFSCFWLASGANLPEQRAFQALRAAPPSTSQ